MHRKILHIDLDAFFCAVEELHDPVLQGRPFAVGGRPEGRGVVASCSYAARRFGVRSAMPMFQALKLCPGLQTVRPHYKRYSAMSREVMERLHDFTPLVEQLSIDEAFLDVSDLPESGEVLARQLQTVIRDELRLPCSVGVAANKLVAKTATDVAKSTGKSEGPPNAILVVASGQESAFLAPLPTDRLWGVGPKTRERLEKLGMWTIGDIARQSEEYLIKHFGKHGHDLALRARGIDDRPVVTTRTAKSVSQEVTYPRDVADRKILVRTLHSQSEQVGRRLRRLRVSGNTIKLKLRRANFTTLTRQHTLSQPTDQDNAIYTVAVQLFDNLWIPGEAVRLIGVGVTGLGAPIRQLSLWGSGEDERRRRLQTTLDSLRDRFDDRIIQRGSELMDEDL